ncbi:DUF4344 domain-containing metallopeptidase [Gemmobacter lanyuensis]
MKLLPLLLSLCLATPALAGEDEQSEFVADNLIATFYHEMGHALIDQLELPVLGREEDAADILSVLLIDEVWEPETATGIAENTALSYVFMAEANADAEPAFWDVHGLDLQRYYSHVCLFYGADPDTRAGFAEDFELPPNVPKAAPRNTSSRSTAGGPTLNRFRNRHPARQSLRAIPKTISPQR